jgi:ribosome biogenesis GTPase A
MVKNVIRTSDVILEVIDSRFVEKTRNKIMEDYIKQEGKKLVYVFNKVDLVDLDELNAKYGNKEFEPYVFFSCKSKIGRTKLRDRIKIEVKKLKIKNMRARVGVIGYPNTGKSSLINILSGKVGTAVSPEAGYTKASHKIRFNKDILILDTPGVYLENEKPELSSVDLKKHAVIGIQSYNKVRNPDFIVSELVKDNPGLFEKYYNIEADGDAEILIEKLGRRMNFLRKGNSVDIERTARLILKDWQSSKIK